MDLSADHAATAHTASTHEMPSTGFDDPIGHSGPGGIHHIERVIVRGKATLRDAHGHPLVNAHGKPIELHGEAAIQTMNAPLGNGGSALFYVWGHMCRPAAAGSGYVRREDLAHAPTHSGATRKDVRHVGKRAPLTEEHYSVAPKPIPKDFAFKKNPNQGTFADYGEGGRKHSEFAQVGKDKDNDQRGVMYMTWNVPDHHGGRGAGIAHAMLTAGDKVTRCRVEPRTVKSVDTPGTSTWWYVHAELHGSSVYGWVLAEADIHAAHGKKGEKLQQLTPVTAEKKTG